MEERESKRKIGGKREGRNGRKSEREESVSGKKTMKRRLSLPLVPTHLSTLLL